MSTYHSQAHRSGLVLQGQSCRPSPCERRQRATIASRRKAQGLEEVSAQVIFNHCKEGKSSAPESTAIFTA